MENEKRNMWQELTFAEATACVGGIVTTGPVRVLNMMAVVASAPIGDGGTVDLTASGPLG